MSACCPTYPRSKTNFFPLLMAILVVLVAVASYHAVMTHGHEAIDAQNCFNHGNVMRESFRNPLTGDTLSICMMQGRWFISIDKSSGENRTMFPRSFAKCLRDVVDYAIRSGFTEKVNFSELIP